MREQSGLTQTCEVLDAHRTFRATIKKDGNMVLEMLGQLSADGKTLYVERTQFDQDKKPDSGLVSLEKQ